MTNAELAILSLVVEAPHHGYEIEQIIEARGMRIWTEVGFSSIYYVLKKLEKSGLIKSEIVPGGRGLGRRVYHTTSEGRAAWQAEALRALEEPEPYRSGFQLGLAGQPALPPDAAMDALRARLAKLDELHTSLQASQAEQQPVPDHVAAMFEHSLALLAAERRWLAGYITRLEETHADED